MLREIQGVDIVEIDRGRIASTEVFLDLSDLGLR
jgi:hypothetical protein